MAADILDWLLRSSLALAVAVALVLVLRPLFRRWLGAGAVLWLYLLVPAALVATSLPGPVQVVEVADAPLPTHRDVVLPAATAVLPAARVPAQEAAPAPAAAASPAPAWPRIALLAWGVAALWLAANLVAQQRRYRRRLGRLQPHPSGAWQAENSGTGPVVIGLLRPRIVVPADFETRYLPVQQTLVLAHERVHLRRGDLPANALACALRCVFWFHPLVHLAAAKLRLDQELACDAAVLRHHPRAGRDYATALLNTQLADLGLPVGCAWQSSHPLAWRITMLSKPSPGSARLALGAGLALLASTATAATIWQRQPATVVTLPAVAAPLALAPLPALAVDAPLPAPAPRALPAAAVATQVEAPAAPAGSPVSSVAPVADPARAPLRPAPAPRALESVQRQTLPPPPTPRAEPPASPRPLAQVAGAPVADPAYQPPKLVLAKPAKIPLMERDPRVAQIRNGIIMRVDVDASGEPVAVAVQESRLGAVYERNAIAAVKRWRFEPARRNGVPEPATVLVPVVFEPANLLVDAFAGEAVAHPRPNRLPPPQPIAGQ